MEEEEKRWPLNQNSGYTMYMVLPQCILASFKNQDSFLELHYCANISESYPWLDGTAYCALILNDTTYRF